MIDCHIHIERGTYTLDWIDKFVEIAMERGLEEIWLLEHCYRFKEFLPMYYSVCKYSDYIEKWFKRKAGTLDLNDYLILINKVRSNNYPVNIKFGLEVCYFEEFESLVYKETSDKGFDFLVGSVHFVNDFAFDHKSEHWEGVNVDETYRNYFETSIMLAKSGIYNGIAHPDCIKIFGHKPSFSLYYYYDKLSEALAENNMYAEQNGGAHRRCPDTAEFGMNQDLIRSMKRHNIQILTASDAHCPEDVGENIGELEKALNFNTDTYN